MEIRQLQRPSRLFTDSRTTDSVATGLQLTSKLVAMITPRDGPTENTGLLLLFLSFPWERVCLRMRYPGTAAYTNLLKIGCLATNVFFV
jgi:hypothetical protein